MPRASQKRLPNSTRCSQASETAEKHSAETSSVQQSSQHTSFDLVRAILDSKWSTQKQYSYPPTTHRSQNITYTFLYRNLDAIIKSQCFFSTCCGTCIVTYNVQFRGFRHPEEWASYSKAHSFLKLYLLCFVYFTTAEILKLQFPN